MQLLADAGFTICTGGYLGVMEAASRGAHERGGRVLGIVMNQFKAEPNRYLTDKVATPHFYERLQRLITRSVGFIAIRGGMGTVTELSLVWNKMQTRVIGPRPLVLLATVGRRLCVGGKTSGGERRRYCSAGLCRNAGRSCSNHYRKNLRR